jgi:hypothetical protein
MRRSCLATSCSFVPHNGLTKSQPSGRRRVHPSISVSIPSCVFLTLGRRVQHWVREIHSLYTLFIQTRTLESADSELKVLHVYFTWMKLSGYFCLQSSITYRSKGPVVGNGASQSHLAQFSHSVVVGELDGDAWCRSPLLRQAYSLTALSCLPKELHLRDHGQSVASSCSATR